MLVLVAFPGAGKSYFSDRLVQATARSNAAAVAAAQSAAAAAAAASSSMPVSSPVAPLLDSSVADSPLDPAAAAVAAGQPPADSDLSGFTAVPSARGGKGRNVSVSAPPAVPGVVPQWVRINQDTLGSRKQCEFFAEKALKEGECAVPSMLLLLLRLDLGRALSLWTLAHFCCHFVASPRVCARTHQATL